MKLSSPFIFFLLTLVCTLSLVPPTPSATPIDWSGALGFDSTNISNYRRLNKGVDNSDGGAAGNGGTQELSLVPDGDPDANWQSSLFRLSPTLIVNDSASIKGEWSSGYARGGFFGSENSQSLQPGLGNALYLHNFSSGNNAIILNKLYAELYSDTATYIVGRHSKHYGLGALLNNGQKTRDRFSSIYDGLTIQIKIGNFNLEPFWSRQGSKGSLTKSTRTKEMGFSLVYDNLERDLMFGILYSTKKSSPHASDYRDLSGDLGENENDEENYLSIGEAKVKLTDLFIQKKWGPFTVALEVPIIRGNLGRGDNYKNYEGRAFIFESSYALNHNLRLSFHAGRISGHNGSRSEYGAIYLNPNYQIANLLFRYNLRAISDSHSPESKNVYDSYLHNSTYFKWGLTYQINSWIWDAALIWAKAEEVAQAGKWAYNHLSHKRFPSQFNQESDLGYELDLNFRYLWNDKVSLGGALGYLVTGNYFAYTNTAQQNDVTNSFVLQFNTSLTF